jgi:hypothetical protein
MFDRVGSMAERMATNVSRRAFLGRLGQGALVLAGAFGAMLAFPGVGQAKGCGDHACLGCCYTCSNGTVLCTPPNPQGRCNDTSKGCPFSAECYCPK